MEHDDQPCASSLAKGRQLTRGSEVELGPDPTQAHRGKLCLVPETKQHQGRAKRTPQISSLVFVSCCSFQTWG